MAVALEFIDFIVPIKIIKEKYPGGWEECIKDHENLIGGRVWYDEHLFRDGAMNPMDMEDLVEEWQGLGFIGLSKQGDTEYFQDFCIVEHLLGGATRRCEWLEISENGAGAYLSGTLAGEIITRNHFSDLYAGNHK